MRINEIFYSIQGEGYHTGTPAIFIRFSGCNLKCSFCDTKHQAYTDLSEDEIVDRVASYPAQLVVVTGGEPLLQLTPSLVRKLHSIGKFVAVETNGTQPITPGVNWVTVSPKEPFVGEKGKLFLTEADEVKVVFDGRGYKDPTFGIKADHYYVQPCDTGFPETNEKILTYCIQFIKDNPQWKLSLQTQKILNVR